MKIRYTFLVRESEDKTDKRVGMFTNKEIRHYLNEGYRILFTEYMVYGVK